MIAVKSISIKDNYSLIEAMMQELQKSEQEMNSMSAEWKSIKANYMSHLISCQEENEGTCLVAYKNKEVAGFLFAYTEDQDESRIEKYEGTELYVSDGFIYPAFRRLGIYQQLNNAIETHYIEKGIRRMIRFTLFSNIRMQKFLEKNGYLPTRILYEKWLDDSGKNNLQINLK
jgi:ribosomal protein S18 acetylase RimI-like enzyme